MQRKETPPQCVVGPQAFKDILYGDADSGWLTIFYTPSRRTAWFPITDTVPHLDLEQNCYLGIGVRRQRPENGGGRGRTDDIFDTLHGSVAYQGAQDTLWVLEGPPHDAVGVLHLREKDSDDQALHVSFVDGHW